MDLIVVKSLPEHPRAKTPDIELLNLLEEFKNSEATVVRVEWSPEELGTQYSAVLAIRRILKRTGYNMSAVMIYNQVYITKNA